jgi:uncharacterized protein (DUF1810 family)
MSGPQTADPFNLQRFVDAQDGIYAQVLAELKKGSKETHWIWFIFPQIRGLGSSAMAEKFAISSQEEAAAYLADPLLGPRLRECTKLVNAVEGRSAYEILGDPDDLKFRSSMTLFATVAEDKRVFEQALKKYFDGEYDPLTLARI